MITTTSTRRRLLPLVQHGTTIYYLLEKVLQPRIHRVEAKSSQNKVEQISWPQTKSIKTCHSQTWGPHHATNRWRFGRSNYDLMSCLKSTSSDRLSQSQVKGAGVMTVSWWKMWPVKQWNQPCFLGNSFNKDTLAIVPLIRLKPVLAWSTIILELYL